MIPKEIQYGSKKLLDFFKSPKKMLTNKAKLVDIQLKINRQIIVHLILDGQFYT